MKFFLIRILLATALAALVVGTDTAITVESADASQKKFLIVAPTQFHGVLKEYVEHKRKLRPTELIALEDVLKATDGVDDPEKLKRFLYDAWRKHDLGYVLLVGDCWASAVRYYYDKENLKNLKPNDDWYPPSIFFRGMKYMFFGDPTLPFPAPVSGAE